jgi:hypothetical protein
VGRPNSKAKRRGSGKNYRLHFVRPFVQACQRASRLRHEPDVGTEAIGSTKQRFS